MEWYYVQDGQRVGPVPREELDRLASAGRIRADTLVWRQGLSDWEPYGAPTSASAAPPSGAAAAAHMAADLTPEPDLAPGMANRKAFLSDIKKKKTRRSIDRLGDHPYDLPALFPKTKGIGVARHIRKKVALLGSLESVFGTLLLPGEEILFATTGVYYNLIEQYFVGWVAVLVNRTAFLFTNYRILMINTDSRHRPLQMKWHIPYDQISRFSISPLVHNVCFRLKDGKTCTFAGVPRPDQKDLKHFVQDMMWTVDEIRFHIPAFQSRDNLCSNCFLPVKRGDYACGHCGETFIRPRKPALMSLLLPCLGDFYLGHHALGAMELVGYLMTLTVLIRSVVEVGAAILPGALIGLAIVHTMDAALTYHLAKKGLVSSKRAWRSHRAARVRPEKAAIRAGTAPS